MFRSRMQLRAFPGSPRAIRCTPTDVDERTQYPRPVERDVSASPPPPSPFLDSPVLAPAPAEARGRVAVATTPVPPSSRIAASASPPQSPPATALPSSRAWLLDAEAVDWQAHNPAPCPKYHMVEDWPNDADETKESAKRASAAAPTAA